MVPSKIDLRGNHLKVDGELKWEKTKADEALPKYDSAFGFHADGKWVPLWRYIEAYERIKDKSGRMRVFALNDVQIAMYAQMAEMKLKGKPVRINDAKARQLGGSTLIAGMFWPLTAFDPGKKCGIVADTEPHGIELLQKYKDFYATTPAFLKSRLRVKKDNTTDFAFSYADGVESSFKVIVQGPNAGNSMTFQYLHESEVAKWPDVGMTIAVLDSTVDPSSKDTIIVRETTAFGSEWKEIFMESRQGRGSFEAMFLPWWKNGPYRLPYDGHPLSRYEEETLVGKLGLDLDQCQFWSSKFHDYKCDPIRMGQEFPSTESEMFQSQMSGVFDPAALQARHDELTGAKPLAAGSFTARLSYSQDGRGITCDGDRFIPDPYGPVRIFEEPKPGHPYVMNCDPAMGGKDEWAVQVIDNSNCRQVAIYAQSGVYESDAFLQSLCLYRHYAAVADIKGDGWDEKRVLACGETNTTEAWCRHMADAGCKVYVSRDETDMFGGARKGVHYGYKTKQTNRQTQIDAFKDAFRWDRGIVSDLETLVEMENFQYVPSGKKEGEKAQATGGFHDDRVMAFAGFFLIRHSFDSQVRAVAERKESPMGFDPLARPKKEKPERGLRMWW